MKKTVENLPSRRSHSVFSLHLPNTPFIIIFSLSLFWPPFVLHLIKPLSILMINLLVVPQITSFLRWRWCGCPTNCARRPTAPAAPAWADWSAPSKGEPCRACAGRASASAASVSTSSAWPLGKIDHFWKQIFASQSRSSTWLQKEMYHFCVKKVCTTARSRSSRWLFWKIEQRFVRGKLHITVQCAQESAVSVWKLVAHGNSIQGVCTLWVTLECSYRAVCGLLHADAVCML